MASRTLTREFVKLRTNSRKRQRPRTVHENEDDDNAPLVSGHEVIEMTALARAPEWEQQKATFDKNLEDIKVKVEQLKVLHNKHASEVGFDDNAEDEMKIEIATKEITDIFIKNQNIIALMVRKSEAMKKVRSDQEQRMASNVQQAMAVQLQDASATFRKTQANYLKRMKSREDRNKHDIFEDIETSNMDDDATIALETGFNQNQMDALVQNTNQIVERERDIINIVNSIQALNTIFTELAILIVDQGTILDRIDYNLETAVHHIDQGNQELVQAEKHQKSAGKKIVIILLVLVVIGMIIGFIVYSKSKK